MTSCNRSYLFKKKIKKLNKTLFSAIEWAQCFKTKHIFEVTNKTHLHILNKKKFIFTFFHKGKEQT